MKPILEIKNISKKFRIKHEQKPYLSLRDGLTDLFKSKKNTDEEFWALKDISFDVMPGDTIGIIGKNGAGKSTLLKILSKITPPSSGKIITRGRIASLLEVGTGFHPELTGRENIFLNGSILGMRKIEIQKNFDSIVDFSGVEKFLDTPLKHYSSGMQLRLAFAVSAFLENEILIIDEVLAVGDAEFQKKCMGKMEEISKVGGRTILFVSHQLQSIKFLCDKGLILKEGRVFMPLGNIDGIINSYLNESNYSSAGINEKAFVERKGNGEIQVESIRINSVDQTIKSGQELTFELKLIKKPLVLNKVFELVIGIWNYQERNITMMSTRYNNNNFKVQSETVTIKCIIPKLQLNTGNYSVNVLVKSNGINADFLEKVLFFHVDENDFYETKETFPSDYDGFYFENRWDIS
jgi:lipopolysaccharide transport system ATP-binding protein